MGKRLRFFFTKFFTSVGDKSGINLNDFNKLFKKFEGGFKQVGRDLHLGCAYQILIKYFHCEMNSTIILKM